MLFKNENKTRPITSNHLIIFLVLCTKIPKRNDKNNIDTVAKMLSENDIATKAISISLR